MGMHGQARERKLQREVVPDAGIFAAAVDEGRGGVR
jgi:hypothetical protein